LISKPRLLPKYKLKYSIARLITHQGGLGVRRERLAKGPCFKGVQILNRAIL